MFVESPSNYYEWIEPRPIFSRPDPNPSFSTFKPAPPPALSQPTQTAAIRHIWQERLSLDSQLSKRPLPPIPNEAVNSQPERNDNGLYKKYRNTNVDPSRWQSRAKGSNFINPLLTRSGSEPNLFGDEREPRLSSAQSLEFLNAPDPVDPKKPKVNYIYIFIRINCSFKSKKLKKRRKKMHTTCQRIQRVKCILTMHCGCTR